MYTGIINPVQILKRALLYFLGLVWFLSPSPLKGQYKNYTFDRIGLEEGLSQSTILAITQDREGFLWLGTQEGLNRYDGYDFVVYKSDLNNKNSLSDNWVTALLVDRENNLWIGTNAGGLNLFDRQTNTFIHFLHDPDDPNSLIDDRVLTLYEDQSESIWIGTMGGGLDRLDKHQMYFEHFEFRKGLLDPTEKSDVTAILEDDGGDLWWGTNGGGLFYWDLNTSSLKHFTHDSENKGSITSNNISVLKQDKQGTIWIGTNGAGLNKYDKKTKSFSFYKSNPESPNSLSDDHIYTLFEDTSGSIWIGTDDGLNQFWPQVQKFQVIKSDPANPNSLSNSMIRSIFEDQGGIIWIGTYSGALNKFDSKKAVFKNFTQNPAKPNSLSDKNVWAICEDSFGNIWIGTNNGLNKLNRSRQGFTHYFNNPSNPTSVSHNLIRSIYQDKAGTLWIGTEGGGLNQYDYLQNNFVRYVHDPDDSTTISDNGLRHIFEDNEGNLWIATLNGLNVLNRELNTFKRYYHDPENPNSLSGNHVRYIYQDSRGAIWIGTFSGLSLYIKKNDNFISFYNNPSNLSSLSNDRVLCMYEDQSGRFWIGTYGGGLEQLDRNEFIFSHYSKEDGLPNDAIYGILEDDEGNLWLSTNQGLSKFNPTTSNFKNYDVNDGLQSNEFNGNAFFKNKNHEMFFGGINGFTVFNPRFVKNNKHIPPIVITSFKKYDKEIVVGRASNESDFLELSYQDNFFSFEFAALDFTNPAKNQYLYKLEGFDKEWVKSGSRRFANYTNLNGGSYIFGVKGSNNDGIWNNVGTSIRLIIHPPFWQTWWFKFLLVILILSAIYILITLRVRSVNSQKRKLELEVAQRTRELNQSNYELLRAKRDTDDILNNVHEGLFLLNNKFEIGSQYSLALEMMLNENSLSNTNFLELISKKVSVDIVDSTKEYLQLMFKKNVDEETLRDLNPLNEVEINFTDDKGSWITSKFLSFKFKRIWEEELIQNLIITVTDITEQIILTKKLKISEERTQNQMEWLVSILHIEPALLNEFLEGADSEIDYVDLLLKRGSGNGNFHHVLEEIYRSIHLIKGNAALLDLKFFADLAHHFEDKINDIRKNSEVQAKDFIPLVLNLGEIKQNLNEIKKLIDRISNFHEHFKMKKSIESDLLLKSIKNLITNLSKDMQKKVEFNYSNFQTISLPYRYRLLIKEILIQFVRNSIYHGVETPADRIKMKKHEVATLALSSEISDKEYIIRFKDDGRGLQIEQMRKIALKNKKFARMNIEDWHMDKVATLIFEPGFTTAEKADILAGRGVGMDLIKRKLEKVNGEIQVEFEKDKYCEFVVKIPLQGHRKKKVKNKKMTRDMKV